MDTIQLERYIEQLLELYEQDGDGYTTEVVGADGEVYLAPVPEATALLVEEIGAALFEGDDLLEGEED